MRINYSVISNTYGESSLQSVDESMLADEPNVAVRKLELTINGHYSQPVVDISRIFAAIATKFAKLQVMHINGYCGTSNELSMLNRLEELSELHIEDGFEGLQTVTLPKLHCIGFHYPYKYRYHNDGNFETRVEILHQFLIRHSTIKKIHIYFYEQQDFISLLEFALTHLKNLELVLFTNNGIRLTESSIENISSLIATHAQAGFRVTANKLKFMKRDDKKVVLEIEGRWEIDE